MLPEPNAFRHVCDFEHCIERFEREEDYVSENIRNEGNHFEEDCRRKRRAKAAIQLKELFNARSTTSDDPQQRVSKILLVGNPGTGKTAFVKKLALLWAEGRLGKQFRVVYFLSFRNLIGQNFDDRHLKTTKTLSTAIANHCFPPNDDINQYEGLKGQISEDLKKKTTLLILDGFGDADDVGKVFLQQAFEAKCKLLFTSRPYNLQGLRSKIDLEVECIGMNEEQLENFFVRETSQIDATSLMNNLRRYPNIWNAAHTPLMSGIFCFLWKEAQTTFPEDDLGSNEAALFRKVSYFMWEQCAKDPSFSQGIKISVSF